MNQVVFKDLGLKDYKEAWDYQNELFQGIIDIKLANRKSELKRKSPHYFLPLAVRVALDTQVIGGLKRHHRRFVSGSTSLVAAQTLHGQVFIPGINNFCPNRMGGMGFPFVALAAQADGNIFLGHQQHFVGGMRGMTAAAVTRPDRLTKPLLVFGIVN